MINSLEAGEVAKTVSLYYKRLFSTLSKRNEINCLAMNLSNRTICILHIILKQSIYISTWGMLVNDSKLTGTVLTSEKLQLPYYQVWKRFRKHVASWSRIREYCKYPIECLSHHTTVYPKWPRCFNLSFLVANVSLLYCLALLNIAISLMTHWSSVLNVNRAESMAGECRAIFSQRSDFASTRMSPLVNGPTWPNGGF